MRLEEWQRGLVRSLHDASEGWTYPGIEIHRANARSARVQALANAYPVVQRVLGKRCFASLARTYAAERPSRCWDLNREGADFPVWLHRWQRTHPALAELPYLGDLARLERAVRDAYYAPDDDIPSAIALDRAARESTRLLLRPAASLFLVASPWPVDSIWRVNRESDPASQVSGASSRIAIWRCKSGVVRVETVNSCHWRLLRAVCRRKSVEELASLGLGPDILERFIERGWIVGVEARG